MSSVAPPQQSPGTGGSPSRDSAAQEPAVGIPLKRILDDDIQFVSEKPVKKQRIAGSDFSATQGKPAEADRKPSPSLGMPSQQQPAADVSPEGEKARPTSQEELRRSIGAAVEAPPKPHAAPPELEPRGVSLPAMDSFAFPQSFTGLLADACHVSPQVSPKQLPQGIGPPLLRLPFPQQYLDPYPYPDMFNLDGPFNYLSAIPQNPPMAPEAAFGQSGLNPAVLMLDGAPPVRDERPPAESSLMALAEAAQYTATPKESSPPTAPPEVKTKPEEQAETHTSQPEAAEMSKDPVAADAIKTFPPSPLAMPQQDRPPPSDPQQPQGQVPPIRPLAAASKGPCLICARLREQACLSNAHGMFLPGMPHGPPPPYFHHPVPLPPTGGGGHGGQLLRGVSGSPHTLRHLNSPLDIAALVSPSPATGRTPAAATSQPTPPPPSPSQAAPAEKTSQQKPAITPPSTPRPAAAPAAAAGSKKPPAPVVVTAAAARLGQGADAKRKQPAPNLYVDIAETCLEMFPYAEVARRHAVSRQRVMDVFAAVIQLPLLRCPTDKRRVGKLGITRMKELNKAKKDLQAERAAAASKSAPSSGQSGSGSGGDPSAPAAPGRAGPAPPPNLYEIAQFIGPLDPPEPMKHGFPGPW